MARATPAGSHRFQLETELARDLGLMEATTIIVGGIIGSGIFGAPAAIAEALKSPGLVMLVWVVGGILAFFGALCFAELGAMMPRSGGQVIYLREAYSPLVAFLYGWTEVFLIQTASMAAIAVIFTSYLGYFFPAISLENPLLTLGGLMISTQQGAMIATMVLLGTINYFGVRFGGWVQNLFTVSKVIALGGLVVLAALVGGNWTHFTPLFPKQADSNLIGVFGAAMIGAMFAYNGWGNANMVAGEIKDPRRQLPRAIVLGLGICTAVYLAVNWSYLYVMRVDEIALSPRIAADMAERLIGPLGAALISLAVMISTFGTLNAGLLIVPRVVYGMAKEGLLFPGLTYVHPVYKTPSRAIVMLTVCAILGTFLGSFQAIIDAFAYAIYVFYVLTVIALFRLRRLYPDAPRPVRVWGYPVIPLVFLAISSWYIGSVLLYKTAESLPGLIFLAAGLPLYWLRFRKRS